MDLNSTFVPSFEARTRNVETFFKEIWDTQHSFDPVSEHWKQDIVNRYGKLMAAMPNLRKTAARVVNEELAKMKQQPIDVENTYLNTFTIGYKDPSDPYYHHPASTLKESYNLADVAVMNLIERDKWGDRFEELESDLTNGLYTAGESAPSWGAHNIVPLRCKWIFMALRDYIPMRNGYMGELHDFWLTWQDEFGHLLADTFLFSALTQYKNRILSDRGLEMVRSVYLGRETCKSVMMDIAGHYYAPDIMCVTSSLYGPVTLLYLPGARYPFLEFASMDEMRTWVGKQLKSARNREAFLRHFSVTDRNNTGASVDKMVQNIVDGENGMSPLTHILVSQRVLSVWNVFDSMTFYFKERTLADRDFQPTLHTPHYANYATEFSWMVESRVQFFDKLAPNTQVPIDYARSCTALGMRLDLVIDPAKLKKPLSGKGQHTGEDLFKAVRALAVSSQMADTFKDYVASQSEYANEAERLKSLFNLTDDQLAAIRVGDLPRPSVPAANRPTWYLVRLGTDLTPLVVMQHYVGMKYQVVDFMTGSGKLIPGEWVTGARDPKTGDIVYLYNADPRTHLPYFPHRLPFGNLWAVGRLKKELGLPENSVPQGPDAVVIDLMERMYAIDDTGCWHMLAFQLLEAIDLELSATTDPVRLSVYQTLADQFEAVLFFPGMESVRTVIRQEIPNNGSGAAHAIYRAAFAEQLAEGKGLTDALIRFAHHDDLVKICFQGYRGAVPQEVHYPVKYVIDGTALDALPTKYYEHPSLEAEELKSNLSVMQYFIEHLRTEYLLSYAVQVDDRFFLGHSWKELEVIFTTYSCGGTADYAHTHGLLFMEMLKELSGQPDHPEAGLMKRFGTETYFRETVTHRMERMSELFHLSDRFDFSRWDEQYNDNTTAYFNATTKPEEKIKLLLFGRGAVMNEGTQEMEYLIANLATFKALGLKYVGVSGLYNDFFQNDIEKYLGGRKLGTPLNACLLSMDQGDSNGIYYRLFTAAKTSNLTLVALGDSRFSAPREGDNYINMQAYGRLMTESIAMASKTDGKYLIFANRMEMHTRPGINAPLPGLCQLLQAPGTYMDRLDRLRMWEGTDFRSLIPDERPRNWEQAYPYGWDFTRADDLILLGLKTFASASYVLPTPSTRESILHSLLDEDAWRRLKVQMDRVKVHMRSFVSSEQGAGETVAFRVVWAFLREGAKIGTGVSIAYWQFITQPDGTRLLEVGRHTAPTVWLEGREYVVDAAHLQYPHSTDDEWTIVLPIREWGEEIASRAGAIHPCITHRMMARYALRQFSPLEALQPKGNLLEFL